MERHVIDDRCVLLLLLFPPLKPALYHEMGII